VLESLDRAMDRGAHIHAELVGYGLSTDAEHITRPTVAGQARAMELALQCARIAAGDVGYVNAHGTATLANDAVETAAIKQVFGPAAHALPVSSTKSTHGHLLGAAGALEFVASVLAIERLVLPPTMHLVHADPECDLDYVAGCARPVATLTAAMSNSFAFGGTNVSLVCRAVG
jgi:3-oxoacyl-[acyl-carrier-protein] synthase II